MKINEKIIDKIDDLISLSIDFEKTITPTIADTHFGEIEAISYDEEKYSELATSSKSLIFKLYGAEHPYYIAVNIALENFAETPALRGILNSIKKEINEGFLLKVSNLVSAEIFSDFIEMAEYLLNKGYKDASAVIIGSTLEEKLRQIAKNNNIDIRDTNDRPKRTNSLNTELYKADIYNLLFHNEILSWSTLRNNAAHGEYDKYDKKQVEKMLNFVSDFSTRIN